MQPLRPNKKRAKNAILYIWLVLASQFFMAICDFNNYFLFKQALDGNVQMDWIEKIDLFSSFIGIISVIIYIIAAITFIMWFRRAYYNLKLCIKTTAYDDSWAAGAWFVPFINLVRPISIMRELYENTHRFLLKRNINNPKLNTKFLGWWWALWIIMGIISNISFRVSLKAEDPETIMNLHLIDGLMFFPSVWLAVITVKVIKDYSSAEDQLIQLKEEIPSIEITKPQTETSQPQ